MSFKNCSKPLDCSLFATTCTPQNPIGSCMGGRAQRIIVTSAFEFQKLL
nr:hypothetical protein [Helicobacter pylori]